MKHAITLALLSMLALGTVSPNAAGASCIRGSGSVKIGSRAYLQVDGGVVSVASSDLVCLSCHDGTCGPAVLEVGSPGLSSVRARGHDFAPSHPVDVVYPITGDEWVPLERLDSAIVLEDGRVVCSTCHDATGTTVLPLAGSELCLACHRK